VKRCTGYDRQHKSRCLLESRCSRKRKSLPLQLLAQQPMHVDEMRALWCMELESDLSETDMRRVTQKVLGSCNTFTSFFLVTE
jgi:hypothetical protein